MIPGTFINPSANAIRWHRGPDHPSGRTYIADMIDGHLKAIVSRDETKQGPLWHVSISHVGHDWHPDRCPTWDEMKHAKYTLVPDDVPMVLIFPRKTAPYTNTYPTCLHLWESTEKDVDL